MNWVVLALITWVFFGIELGLRDAFRLGLGGIAPSFVFVLLSYIAITARPQLVLWCCVLFGVLTDLTGPVEMAGGAPPLTVVGPHALGFLLAGQLMVSMRALLMRANPPTLAFTAGVGYAVAQIVAVGLFTLRSWMFGGVEWHPTHELLVRLGSAACTGVLGFLLSFILAPVGPLLGMQVPSQRRFSRR